MKVQQVMSKNPTWLKPDANVRELAKRMKKLDAGIIPIGDGKKLLGMVSDRDITLWLANGGNPDKGHAKDIMRKDIFYCFQDDDIHKAANSMEKQQIHRLVVLDNKNNKHLVGIVSLGDIANKTHDQKLCGEVVEKISQKKWKAA